MERILCVTVNPAIDISCEADRIQPTLKVRTRGQRRHPGGGGTNVARAIATLGGEPELAFLCGGATGKLYEEMLEKLPIQLMPFTMQGSVRVAFMVHENETGFEYRFIPEGPEVLVQEIEPLMEFIEAFDGGYIIASGSLPLGVPADTYAQMADIATAKQIRFVLDTSGEALQTALSNSKVFLVKPSLGELEILAGRKLDENGIRDMAADIITTGAAQNVAVSMGLQGALLATASGFIRIPSLHVKVRSAVGAGDSFVGAMTWSLANGNQIEDAFRLGIAAGAATVMTPGTELCRREDVFGLFETLGPTTA